MSENEESDHFADGDHSLEEDLSMISGSDVDDVEAVVPVPVAAKKLRKGKKTFLEEFGNSIPEKLKLSLPVEGFHSFKDSNLWVRQFATAQGKSVRAATV